MSKVMSNSKWKGSFYKRIGAIGGLAYAVVGIYQSSPGDTIFGLFIAMMAFGDAFLPDPGDRLALFNSAVQSTFRNSDDLARVLLLVIAFGGTLLVLDVQFGVRFIFDLIDPWVKRLAPILLITTVTLYIVFVISKLVFEASVKFDDKSILLNEIYLYYSTLAFLIMNAILWIGVNTEEFLPDYKSNESRRQEGIDEKYDPSGWAALDPFAFQVMRSLTIIALIWTICFIVRIVSRYVELYWKERLEN